MFFNELIELALKGDSNSMGSRKGMPSLPCLGGSRRAGPAQAQHPLQQQSLASLPQVLGK
jgi:hypothetical protein